MSQSLVFDVTVKVNELKDYCVGYYNQETGNVDRSYPHLDMLPSTHQLVDISELMHGWMDIGLNVINLTNGLIGYANNLQIKKVSEKLNSDSYFVADIVQTDEELFFETELSGRKQPALVIAKNVETNAFEVVHLGYLNKLAFDRYLTFGAPNIEKMLKNLKLHLDNTDYFSLWTSEARKPKSNFL